jgi:coenzyme F420 hydrogenase subunit beta
MSGYRSIDDVVAWRACVGCGACAYLAGSKGLSMRDLPECGHRPVRTGGALECSEAELLAACPGAATSLPIKDSSSPVHAANGPTLEIWEGHAVDPERRFSGASGGALTALAAYCLERGGMDGVLHLGGDPDHVLQNRTVLSRSSQQLRENSGSRYSPGSVCAGLHLVNEVPGPCLFIGQPSEVAGLRKLQILRPRLREKVGLAVSFFCAGSPPSQGTLDLLKEHQIDPRQVTELRYRGRGWPGNFAVWVKGVPDPVVELTYAESWAFLQRYRPWAVQIWPDGSGEQADITCGDPWYRKVKPSECGSSLIIARTEAGRRTIRAAMEAGYLELVPLDAECLIASQENLISKKGAVWGRLLTMRLLGIPTPRHDGYSLFPMWRRLPLREKVASIAGTVRRILQRGYRKRQHAPAVIKPTGSSSAVAPTTNLIDR